MDVRQLRYFVALAEELHFRRAAERLHIAQPALSQQLRSLEAELGLRLVERTNRRVALTDAGTRLLAEARAVVGRFDEAVATMRRVRSGDVATLRVGVFPGPLRTILPRALAELRASHPDVEVETRYLPASDQVAAVVDGRLDVALIPSFSTSQAAASLVETVIDRRPLGIAVPSAHEMASKEVLEPADLAGLPLVMLAPASDLSVHRMLLAALETAGVRPRSILESSTPEASLSIVAAGLATSVKSADEVAQAEAAGEAVAWRPLAGFELELFTVAAWHPERTRSVLEAFVAALADAAN